MPAFAKHFTTKLFLFYVSVLLVDASLVTWALWALYSDFQTLNQSPDYFVNKFWLGVFLAGILLTVTSAECLIEDSTKRPSKPSKRKLSRLAIRKEYEQALKTTGQEFNLKTKVLLVAGLLLVAGFFYVDTVVKNKARENQGLTFNCTELLNEQGLRKRGIYFGKHVTVYARNKESCPLVTK